MSYAAIISRELRECAWACHECKDACLELLPHCLEQGGEFADGRYLLLLVDCAQICGVAEEFMHRGSARHHHACLACAEVCEQCAEACDRLNGGDGLIRRCAGACHECARACRVMCSDYDPR